MFCHQIPLIAYPSKILLNRTKHDMIYVVERISVFYYNIFVISHSRRIHFRKSCTKEWDNLFCK